MRISIDESAGMLVALQLRVAVVLLIWCVVRRLTHTSSARLQSCLDRLLGAILCLYVVEEVAATGPPLERRVQLRLQVERSRRGSPRSFSLVTASAVLLMVAAHGVAWRPATAEDDAARAAGFELESLVWRPEGLIDLAGSARGAHFWDSTTVAFSPDGRLIATGSGNTTGVLHLWDAPTLRGLALVDRLPGGVESVSFSLDGKYLAAAINNSVVRYDEDRSAEIRIWELSANGLGKEHRLTGFKTSFAALDISRRHVMAAANRRGRVHIFDLSGEHPLERPSLTAQSVWSLAFSPDGRRLAAGGSKRTFVWDMSGPQPQRLGDLDGAALSLAFSGDSKLLATGSFASDPMIQLWSLSGDEATLAAEAALDTKRGIRGVEFVGDTLIGCLGRPEKAMVWSTADGGLRRLDNPPIGDCWAAAWNKKTNHVAVVGEGRLEVWDFNTSPPARTAASQSAIDAPRFRNAAFLENDNLLAGLVSDRPAVYDRRRRELVFQTPHVAETPLSLVASSSADLVLSLSRQEQTIEQLRAKEPAPMYFYAHRLQSGEQLYRRVLVTSNTAPHFRISPDGSKFALAQRESPLELRDAATGDMLLSSAKPLSGAVRAIRFLDGDRLLVVTVAKAELDEQAASLQVWNLGESALETGPTARAWMGEQDGRVVASNTGRVVAVQRRDCVTTVMRFDGERFHKHLRFDPQDGQLFIDSISDDGRWLSLHNWGSLNGNSIAIWDTQSGSIARRWEYPGAIYGTALSSSGTTLLSEHHGGELYLLSFDPSQVVPPKTAAAAQSEPAPDLTPGQVAAGRRRFTSLLEEFRKQREQYTKDLKAATGEQRVEVVKGEPHGPTAVRMMEIAKEFRGTRVEFDALIWICQTKRVVGARLYGEVWRLQGEAARRLLDAYFEEQRLAEVVSALVWMADRERAGHIARRLVRESPHREVQGRALLELVSYFQQRGRFFPRRSRADNGPAIKEVLKIMISDYPDIKTPRGVTLKQYAEERLAVD